MSLAAGVALAAPARNISWEGCDGRRLSVAFEPRWVDQRLHVSVQPAERAWQNQRLPQLSTVSGLAHELAAAVRAAPRSQSELERARLRAGRYAERLAQRRRPQPGLPEPNAGAAGGLVGHELGMSVAEASGARAHMCRRHIVQEIGSGVTSSLTSTMSTHFFGSIGGALCKMMSRPIGAVFGVLLLLLFICFVASAFIEKIGMWEDKILPTAISMMLPHLVVSYLAQAPRPRPDRFPSYPPRLSPPSLLLPSLPTWLRSYVAT